MSRETIYSQISNEPIAYIDIPELDEEFTKINEAMDFNNGLEQIGQLSWVQVTNICKEHPQEL